MQKDRSPVRPYLTGQAVARKRFSLASVLETPPSLVLPTSTAYSYLYPFSAIFSQRSTRASSWPRDAQSSSRPVPKFGRHFYVPSDRAFGSPLKPRGLTPIFRLRYPRLAPLIHDILSIMPNILSIMIVLVAGWVNMGWAMEQMVADR